MAADPATEISLIAPAKPVRPAKKVVPAPVIESPAVATADATPKRPRLRHLRVYIFGKHPAWRDFINPLVLPKPHRFFRNLHERWRPTIETHFGPNGAGSAARPHVLAWEIDGSSAVVLIHPSRDHGDRSLGQFRRAPLFLGISAPCELSRLTSFAVPRLSRLLEKLADPSLDEQSMTALLHASLAEWDNDYATFRHDHRPGWASAFDGPRSTRPHSWSQRIRRMFRRLIRRVQFLVSHQPPRIRHTDTSPEPLVAAGEWASIAAGTDLSRYLISTSGGRVELLHDMPDPVEISGLLSR